MKKKLYAVFILQYFIMFMAFGAFSPFVTLFIKNEIKASDVELGLAMSVGALIPIISLLVFGLLADYTKKYKLILNIILVLTAISTFLTSTSVVFSQFLLFYLCYRLFAGNTTNIDDSISVTACKEQKMNYGMIRGMGSIGYIIGSMVSGFLINSTGNPRAFLYFSASCFLTAAVIAIFYPNVNTEKEPPKAKDFKGIIKNKNFIVLVIAATLAMATTSIGTIYDPLLVESFGRADLIGYISLFMAGPELIILALSILIIKKIGYKRSILIGAFSCVVRWSLIYFTHSLPIFFLATTLHSVAIGLIIPSISYYVVQQLSRNVTSSALAFYTIFTAIATSVLTMIVGEIVEMTSDINNVYLFATGISLLACLVILLFNEKEVKN